MTFPGSFARWQQFTSGIPEKNSSYLHTKKCALKVHASIFTHFNQPLTIARARYIPT